MHQYVLIVDDDAVIAEIVKTHLDCAGFKTHIAHSGNAALAAIYKMAFDGMILDISLPDLDGFSILVEMANNNCSKKIPTLILSGSYTFHHINRAIALGARDYLAKPFDDKQLISRVTRLVREHRPTKIDDAVAYI